MTKFTKKIVSGSLAALMLISASSLTAFAASPYANSVGSATEDIKILDQVDYTVAGQDTTQNKKSTYERITLASDSVVKPCEVYATIAEGSKVYDPTNPEAGEDGFVDGSIIVSLPTTLILDGTPDASGYYIGKGTVQARGNIAGTSVINVVPDASVTLSQTGKADITATVETDYTQFAVPTTTATGDKLNKNLGYTFNDNCKAIVTVKTDEASAGSWSGSYNNTVSLTSIA